MTHDGVECDVLETGVLGEAHVAIEEHIADVVGVLNIAWSRSEVLSSTVQV
jgi:hypothetical protein